MKNHIIYHKDCMDGLSSAFIAHCSFLELEQKAEFYPMHYNEIDQVKNIPLERDDILMLLDFSLPKEIIEKIAENNAVVVIDHHKTAMHLTEIKNPNVSVIFDLEKSGAILTFEYFESLSCNPLNKELFEYIQDRDLWKWKLPGSKEVSSSLALQVEKNNINSFKQAYWVFQDNQREFKSTGTTVLKMQQKQVDEKVDKCFEINILGHKFKAINATENVSELGNAICNKYNMPTLIYFQISRDEVVLSFRSLDHLVDVSEIAKRFGGGGHKCASGATIQSYELQTILNNEWH